MSLANEELMQLSDPIELFWSIPTRCAKDIQLAVSEYIQAPELILFTTLHIHKN